VKEFYTGWPIECLTLLPRKLKGLYILYDAAGKPIRVGIAGRGRQDVYRRLHDDYHRWKHWRAVDHFSVFTFTTPTWFEQVERIVLKAAGPVLTGNKNSGSVMLRPEGLKRPPPRQGLPRDFLRKRVNAKGYVKVGETYARRNLRIEVGTRSGTSKH